MVSAAEPGRLGAALFDLVQAPIRWQVVRTAIVLGVFDLPAEGFPAAEAAARLGLDAGRTALFLDALAAMGLMEKTGGLYRATAEAAAFLSAASPTSLARSLLQLGGLRHAGLERLPDLLRGEAAARADLDLADPEFWRRAVASLRSFHRGLGCGAMLEVLDSLPEWPGARRFLDIGAGSETLCLAVKARRPEIDVTLFDLPGGAARIAADLAAAGRADAVAVRPGNYNADDFGEGHDVIWASMTLYYADDLAEVLRRVRRALAPGGVFVSFHEGLTGERTAPETHVIGRLMPALRGQDVSFDRGRIAEAARSAGFRRVDSRAVDTAFGPMWVDCAR